MIHDEEALNFTPTIYLFQMYCWHELEVTNKQIRVTKI